MLLQGIKVRSDVEAALIRKAWADKEFKNKLIADPGSVYRAELKGAGAALLADAQVRVLEEDGNTLYLVIPQMEVSPNTEVNLHDRSTRADFEAALILRALHDSEFKKFLLENPRAVYEAQLASVREAARLPENLAVKTVEESDGVLYFRLPQPPPEGGELNMEELEEVAGGVMDAAVVITAAASVGVVVYVVAMSQDPQQTSKVNE